MTTKRHNFIRNTLIALALLPAAACEGIDGSINEGLVPLASWKASEWDPHAQAEWVNLEHTVGFASGAMMLNNIERQRLAAFLQQSDLTETDRITLSAARANDGAINPTDLARLDAVRAELKLLGLKIDQEIGEKSVASNKVGITVRRAVVMAPDCSVKSDAPFEVRPEMRVGCTTAYNLGQMVAFPEDLIEGRGLSAADGAKGATSIDRYRADKVKKVKEERTTN